MVICTDGDWISFIQINNIKVTIDSEICLFFSEPKSFKNKLEFNRNISDLLLIKFGVPFWASALDEKFVAIKFLFTYSPILSKLMKYDNISDVKIIDNEKDYPNDHCHNDSRGRDCLLADCLCADINKMFRGRTRRVADAKSAGLR